MSDALLLVGHGSHLSPDSSEPVLRLAAAIRELDAFAEVGVAFWKEEPSLPRAFDQFRSRSITVVPIFISEGYFTQQVIPRELRLDGPETERDGLHIRYTDAIGSHALMNSLIVARAEEAGAGEGDTVVVLGHGTPRNENSARNIVDRADEVRATSRFAAVHALFLEQDPNIIDVFDLVGGDRIVVVPFFVAEGWHVGESIPEDLSISDGTVRRGPRTLIYTKPVGTHPKVREVVLDLAGARPGSAPASRGETRRGWARPADIGQLHIEVRGSSATILGPANGRNEQVEAPATPEMLHEFLRYDSAGRYRPLSGARTMREGWRVDCAAESLPSLVEAAYPLAAVHAAQFATNELRVVSLDEVLARQSGRYESASAISSGSAATAIAALCGICVRSPIWADNLLLRAEPNVIPCPEPCSVLIELCREAQIIDDERPTPAPADPDVPFARFDLPGNVVRERYLERRSGTLAAHE